MKCQGLTTKEPHRHRLVVFQRSRARLHDEAVTQPDPDFDALLAFLANWETIERSALGTILTAGQLADAQELERIYTLPPANEDQ